MKKFLHLIIASLCALSAYSQGSQFENDGITYTIVDPANHTVEVNTNNNFWLTGDVTIPATVAYEGTAYTVVGIARMGFFNCPYVNSVKIPDTVTSIGDGAFQSCSSLISVDIPNSVTHIGMYVFNGCLSLTEINCASDNPNYSSKDGIIFNKDRSTLIICPAGKRGSYKIPDSVTSIGESAFRSCSELTSIDIPNSVTSIGDYAFLDCGGLTTIEIPPLVTSIGFCTFFDCKGLTSLNIPNSVTSIGESAFSLCSALTSMEISGFVTSIGDYAFQGCTSLQKIDCAEDNPNYSSEDGILFDKNRTTLIVYPAGKSGSYEIPQSVTSIGNAGFSHCAGLTSIKIPNSVTSIGDWAFNYCSGLTTMELPNSVTSIKAYTFQGCSSMTSIEIPNSVTSIGDWAFFQCSSLTSINLPNSVTSIGEATFGDCNSLASLVIPNSITSIGRVALYCSGLTKIYYNCEEPLSIPDLIIFSDETYSNATLYVPSAAIEKVHATEPWRNFANIEAYEFDGIEAIAADIDKDAPAEVYTLSGVKVASSLQALPAGIYVVTQNGRSHKVAVK